MDFADFILLHDADDPGRLALSRDRLSRETEDFDLALSTLESRRKLRGKVPEWISVPSLRYPLRLGAEQCSSSETAFYKASLLGEHSRVADLTGGLGVDSWAFSRFSEKVLYNEMDTALAQAARHNFRELGISNITVRNQELKAGTLAEILGDFSPDVLYLDPARRAADGRKVFRLEDCRPNVMELLPELLTAVPRVLLKISPMADISLVCNQLGCVRNVHVVESGGECKELVLVLERGWTADYDITVFSKGNTLTFSPSEEISSLPEYAGSVPSEHDCLFEPGKALLKSGAFKMPSTRFGLQKLGVHTHLYVGKEVPDPLRPFGKVYEILETMPLNHRGMKEAAKRYPQAEVTARNVPVTSDQLRRKAGFASGSDVHIFGVKVDFCADSGNYLLITRR